MGNFGQKVDKFIEIFLEQNGYVKVVEGLQNTLLIAVTGLIIGILIGTIIATVRVLPKYKRLPRILNGICSFYVALFRGTPMVVQLLVFYYVLLPILGETFLEAVKGELTAGVGTVPLMAGFLASFITGCLACRFMLEVVQRGRLIWFAVYCAAAGLVSIISYLC